MRIVCFILWISIFVLPTAGLLNSHYEISKARKDIKKKLVKGLYQDELEIRIHKKDLENGNIILDTEEMELIIGDKFYDIISIGGSDDSYIIQCISDSKETALHAEISQLLIHLLSKDSPIKNHTNQIFIFLKSLYYSISPVWISNDYPSQMTRQLFHFICYFSAGHLKTSPPPPENR